ncbi:pre-mRNA-splicing factor 18-like [Diaphorina citri]|uniref:Pre-mRNA-splicing factor 18-like n=1 Tax=Diaphorina citri TaxID=121845 RepID=A0A3Q0INY7_DIACI|nr:pre-mRNA-splicing factor 18-like [Diaphorina citri]
MDILKAEIERKRKLLEESKIITENKKFFKGSELKAKQEEEYNKKYGPKAEDTLEKSSTSGTDSSRYDGSLHQTLPRKEVIRRLRERGEPITMFGESETDSFQRLRQCEIQEPEINKGFRNDFQEALEKVDQTYLDELLASQAQTSNSRAVKEEEISPEKQITYDDIQNMAKDLGKGDRNLDMNVTLNLIQRTYIQGLKRLMTKCQQFYPTDPSRCVEYVPDDER